MAKEMSNDFECLFVSIVLSPMYLFISQKKMNEQRLFFWRKIELDLGLTILEHIKNGFTLFGVADAVTFKNIDDNVIDKVEVFIRDDVSKIVTKWRMFVYEDGPESFKCTYGERMHIQSLVRHVKGIVGEGGAEYVGVEHFKFIQSKITNSNEDREKFQTQRYKFNSSTHYFLNKLIVAADRNILRKTGGYRYDSDIICFASYFRLVAGRLAYETLRTNLPAAIPALSTIDRHIYRFNCQVIEGVPRFDELALFLERRSLEKSVALSEDATRIVGRIQYDSKTNQIVGFVLPMDEKNGMPIPFSFQARSVDEIVKHFSENNSIASYVNVMMAQPIGSKYSPPFCLLIYGPDNKFTSDDVCKRWKYISRELNKRDIKVIMMGTDSDPRYNSAMRRLSMLGINSKIFDESEWFKCGNFSSNIVKLIPFTG